MSRELASDADLLALAARALDAARAAGASSAEACLENVRAFTVRAHGGTVESLKQSGTLGLGVSARVDGRIGFASGTDLSDDGIADLARHAVALARFATPDEAGDFASRDDDEGGAPGDLGTHDPAAAEWDAERKIAMALELERLALAHDRRVTRTDGSAVSSSEGAFVIANSHGIARAWRGTSVSAWVVALADDGARQQTGVWGSSHRSLAELPAAEVLAREAARRAVAKIGARSVPFAKVPVVMDPDVATSWIGEMSDAFCGDAVIQKRSWVADRLGDTIGSSAFTLVDDGRRPRGTGTSPYDGEGVPTRRTCLVERGRCAAFLWDTYHARRAGVRSTGNAVRGFSGRPGVGVHNLWVEPGTESRDAILARVERGFYFDNHGSFGFNGVTGDYSYQASGFWIENGALAFPVDGVTVAGTSLEMLRDVQAVGNDLEFRGSVACPTLLIGEMTVGGAGA